MTTPTDPDPTLLLDNQLCFLVYRLQRSITDRYRPILGELGLTYPQYLVMLALWESKRLTVSELGERLSLDSGTVSPLLKRLESGELIRRQRSKVDERSVEISLTARGRALRKRALAVPPAVGECFATSADEYWALRHQLSGLLQRVEEANAADLVG
ncbi:MAG: MarR family transcriptional regulator [Actinomycetota bacterium]|nr:MarR family transcriptional regulator [Actinomycetota bacterium]